MTCPHCNSADIRRSNSLNWFDSLRLSGGSDPYRCRSCRKRFFHSQTTTKKSSPPDFAGAMLQRLNSVTSINVRKQLLGRPVTVVIFAAAFILFLIILFRVTTASNSSLAPGVLSANAAGKLS